MVRHPGIQEQTSRNGQERQPAVQEEGTTRGPAVQEVNASRTPGVQEDAISRDPAVQENSPEYTAATASPGVQDKVTATDKALHTPNIDKLREDDFSENKIREFWKTYASFMEVMNKYDINQGEIQKEVFEYLDNLIRDYAPAAADKPYPEQQTPMFTAASASAGTHTPDTTPSLGENRGPGIQEVGRG